MASDLRSALFIALEGSTFADEASVLGPELTLSLIDAALAGEDMPDPHVPKNAHHMTYADTIKVLWPYLVQTAALVKSVGTIASAVLMLRKRKPDAQNVVIRLDDLEVTVPISQSNGDIEICVDIANDVVLRITAIKHQ